jgi:hypothetical protein
VISTFLSSRLNLGLDGILLEVAMVKGYVCLKGSSNDVDGTS